MVAQKATRRTVVPWPTQSVQGIRNVERTNSQERRDNRLIDIQIGSFYENWSKKPSSFVEIALSFAASHKILRLAFVVPELVLGQ